MTSSGEPTWVDLIGHYATQRERLATLQPDISPMTAPHLAATPADIAAAEQRLGHPLDHHRALLEHGNGWPAMYLDIDLLSTEDLGQGPAWEKAQWMLDEIFEEPPQADGLPGRDDLVPIGVSQYQTDLLLLWKSGPETAGGRPVSWLIPSDEVERYANLQEMFLDAIRLVRRRIEKLDAENPS